MDGKINIDLSELKSMMFPGEQSTRNNVTSKDVLKNFAKRVDGVTLEDDAIEDYFISNYNFVRGENIDVQTNRLINNYVTVINDILSDLAIINKNITNIKNMIATDKESYLYKKQQYFLKINYEAKSHKEALLFGELQEKIKNRMGQFHNGDKDVESLSKLDDYTMFNYLYDISLDFGVFTKFFDVIKFNKEEVFKLIDKKKTDPEAYYEYAKKFIDENRVLDYIYIKVKEHYLLSEKEEVFNILYNLFKHGAYQTFVSLGAIQVEGLFYDFCSAINGGVRKQEEGTLVNKVDKVFKNNRAQALIYYPYFAYDVPIYRNEVAHNGTIVSQEAEHIAIDILLDMYTVIKLMQQDWLPFNNLKSLIWQLKIYKQIPSLTNKYIDKIFIELYSFFMMRKEDGDFGVFRIMKNRDKYKDILEHYIMHYEDKTDTNLFDEAAELLQVLGQESFWQYTLDIIRDMGLSGTNFAQFVTILVNEFIGYLPKGSSSHRLCIKVKKELDAYNLSLHNG